MAKPTVKFGIDPTLEELADGFLGLRDGVRKREIRYQDRPVYTEAKLMGTPDLRLGDSVAHVHPRLAADGGGWAICDCQQCLRQRGVVDGG